MASMRLRSLSVASSEIIRISTHIEQGFRPSSRPIAIVNAGRPTSSSVTVLPNIVTSNPARPRLLLRPCRWSPPARRSSAPSAPAGPGRAWPCSAPRISLSVDASSEYPKISCPPTKNAGTRALPAVPALRDLLQPCQGGGLLDDVADRRCRGPAVPWPAARGIPRPWRSAGSLRGRRLRCSAVAAAGRRGTGACGGGRLRASGSARHRSPATAASGQQDEPAAHRRHSRSGPCGQLISTLPAGFAAIRLCSCWRPKLGIWRPLTKYSGVLVTFSRAASRRSCAMRCVDFGRTHVGRQVAPGPVPRRRSPAGPFRAGPTWFDAPQALRASRASSVCQYLSCLRLASSIATTGSEPSWKATCRTDSRILPGCPPSAA